MKVEGHPDLVRDSKSKAIINVNRSAVQEHQQQVNMKKNIKNLSDEIVEIKQEFSEIKALLQQLVSRGQ